MASRQGTKKLLFKVGTLSSLHQIQNQAGCNNRVNSAQLTFTVLPEASLSRASQSSSEQPYLTVQRTRSKEFVFSSSDSSSQQKRKYVFERTQPKLLATARSDYHQSLSLFKTSISQPAETQSAGRLNNSHKHSK